MKETYYLVRNNSRIQIRAIESAESGPLDDNHSAQPAAAFKQLKWHFQGRSWAFGPQPVLTAPRRHGHPCPPCSREAAAELFDLMGWTLERAGGSNPIPEPSAIEAGRDRAAEGLAERRAESCSGKTRPSTRGTAPRVPPSGLSRTLSLAAGLVTRWFPRFPGGPRILSCVCISPPEVWRAQTCVVLRRDGRGLWSKAGTSASAGVAPSGSASGAASRQGTVRESGRSEGHAVPSGASGAGDDPSLLLSPWLLRLVVSSGQITQSRFFHR